MSTNKEPEYDSGLIAAAVIFVVMCLTLPKPWGALLLIVGLLATGSFFYIICGRQGDTAKDYAKRGVKAFFACVILFLLCGGWGIFFIGK